MFRRVVGIAAILGSAIVCAQRFPVAAHPLSQGQIDLAIRPNQIVMRVHVAYEEIIVEQALPSGNDDHFTVSPDACRKHGAYLLRHISVIADGMRLDGRVERIDESGTQSVHVLDVGRAGAMYEIAYALERPAERVVLSQNVLNEKDYAPGNRWEVTYIVTVDRSGVTEREMLLLDSRSPLMLAGRANAAGQPPVQLTPLAANRPSLTAVNSESENSNTTHRVAGVVLAASGFCLIAIWLKRRSYKAE